MAIKIPKENFKPSEKAKEWLHRSLHPTKNKNKQDWVVGKPKENSNDR